MSILWKCSRNIFQFVFITWLTWDWGRWSPAAEKAGGVLSSNSKRQLRSCFGFQLVFCQKHPGTFNISKPATCCFCLIFYSTSGSWLHHAWDKFGSKLSKQGDFLRAHADGYPKIHRFSSYFSLKSILVWKSAVELRWFSDICEPLGNSHCTPL